MSKTTFNKTHDEPRSSICLLCFNKTKEIRVVKCDQEQLIRQYFIANYNSVDRRFPNAVCGKCRKIIQKYAKGNFQRTVNLFDYCEVNKTPPITRS